VKLFAATATAFLALMAGAAARPDIHTVQPDPTPVAADGPLAPARARHSVTVGGAEIPYLASWSELVLANGAGVPQATISATSYVREGVPNPAQRPVLFLFNGGPGASSSPLHFSAFGPRRLMQAEPGGARKLVENHDSLIDAADLVFIDPVGTGFSRELREGGGKAYWSPEGDAQAVLAFIRHWLSENNRAASPVFVAGESYGGYRLALMARHMENLNVQGLILLSPMLDPALSAGDQHYIITLPTLAVAAWHHGKASSRARTPEAVWEEARAFAQGDYAVALQQGSALPGAERERLAARMAALIGLPTQEISKANLRINSQRFLETLLPDTLVGRLDVRITAPKAVPPANRNRPAAANDPALGLGKTNVIRSAPIAEYLRRDIGVGTRRDYFSLTLDVNFNWDWRGENRYPASRDATPHIAALMEQRPEVSLLLLGGYYDLATPVLGPWYAITHGGIPLERVRRALLPAGHSPFEGDANRQQVAETVRAFLRGE